MEVRVRGKLKIPSPVLVGASQFARCLAVYQPGMSHAMIAEDLGMSVGSVGNYLRISRKLHADLQAELRAGTLGVAEALRLIHFEHDHQKQERQKRQASGELISRERLTSLQPALKALNQTNEWKAGAQAILAHALGD